MLVVFCGMACSEPFSVQTSAVDLHTEDHQIGRVGHLVFQGGLNLTAPDPRFGGLSGLAVSADGSHLSAVTDKGDWVLLSPTISPAGRLIGLAGAQIGDLRDRDGRPLRKKRRSDAESLAPIDGGFAVSFERRHRLWLYRGAPNPFLARPTVLDLPAQSRAMSRNKGVESLARLRNGGLIAIAENFPKDEPFAQGWIFENNRWHGIRYRRRASFQPTGAVALPDGGVLVLERRFSYLGGFGTRIIAISSASIRPGADLSGREVARLEHPLITENFEGIASYKNATGKTILYLISDDNFGALQRTILLKFALER